MLIKKRIKIILEIVLLGLIISGCEDFNKVPTASNGVNVNNNATNKTVYTPRRNEIKEKQGEQVLLYLDLTTSINEEGLNSMSGKVSQVLLHLPYNSKANLRVIDKNLLSESPFTEIITPAPCEMPHTTIKRELVEARNKCIANQKPFIDLIAGESQTSIVNKIKNLNTQQNTSCIINTLESAYDFFKSKDKNKYNFRLIYFSDMVEQCKENSIFICSSGKLPNKEIILKRIESTFNPTYNLKELIGNNVSIIITSNILDDPKQKCLSISDQKEVWSKIFSKIGYTKEDFDFFNFTQEIPDNLKQ